MTNDTTTGDGIPGGRIRRAAPLLALTLRAAAEATVTRTAKNRRDSTPGSRAELHTGTAERYAELLGRSKGALMKAGQMISFGSTGLAISPDLQAVYRTAFAQLRDDAPPMAPELAHKVLEQDLGDDALRAFAEFDWEPIAAASIGQVHEARLQDGRPVAVKIQYPGVAEAIHSDLKNAQLLVSFLGIMMGLSPRRLRADIRGAASQMGALIADELDYTLEAASQAEFARRYRGHPFIHVPEVITRLSSERVLTQELRSGLSWQDALNAEQRLRDRWAESLWRFFYGSFIRFGLLHLDPHPGNFLFHDDGSVSFLDFGGVARYTREQVDLSWEIARASSRADVLTTWRLCVEAGYWRSSDPVTPEEAFAYWREPFRYIWDQQPFAFTPEYADRWIECRASPSGPCGNALCHMTMPADFIAWPRLEVGVASMLGHLRATNDWASIHAEYADGAEPLTEMGRLDRAHFTRH